ncbi:MAG: RdgB/HAM1 family non-canonical purine NTP pyrophosphatase [Chitinophagaceae bacterium]
MHTLVFATHNDHKANELRSFLPTGWNIITLKEAGILQEIPEPFDTLEENAREKSMYIYQLTGNDCFSEDTGLEVEALAGAPGARSARYAGEGCSNDDNIRKLLSVLHNYENKKASFRTVVSLILDGKEYQFEGECKGKIISERKGEHGFGYDSIFIPEGDTRTFAEMDLETKNKYSHRKKAMSQLIVFLKNK